MNDHEIPTLFPTGVWGNTSMWDGQNFEGEWYTQPLPFPESWTLDEDGISVEWEPSMWAADTEYLKIIPFWHEAE